MSENPVTQFLLRRRSVVAKKMTPTPPESDHLQIILECAIRVPDHSNVQPWRITVFEGNDRIDFDEKVIFPAAMERAIKSGESMTDILANLEKSRMQRSGVVVAVLYKPVIPHKIPEWEQQLSCGAVCSHLLIAAQSYGYAAQWISEWIAYDHSVITALGGNPITDKVAGFIHIGEMTDKPSERKRPIKDNIIRNWKADHKA